MSIIISSDLYLREIETSDAARLYNLIDKNREYLGEWLDWVKYNKSVEDRLEYIEGVIEDRINNKADSYVIIYKNEVVGIIGYTMKTEYTAIIGYWIDRNSQGNGIVSRGCEQLVELLFNNKGVHRAEIRVAENNLKSRKIPERLNFQFEGILRDIDFRNGKFESEAIYSLLSTELE